MTCLHTSANTKPETLNGRELSPDTLDTVSAGFLVFTFKLVAVKTISWAHDDEAPAPSK